jgi:hypothetical protein
MNNAGSLRVASLIFKKSNYLEKKFPSASIYFFKLRMFQIASLELKSAKTSGQSNLRAARKL